MTFTEMAIIETLSALITDLAGRKSIDLAAIDESLSAAQARFSDPKFVEFVAILNLIRESTNKNRQKEIANAVSLITEPPRGSA